MTQPQYNVPSAEWFPAQYIGLSHIKNAHAVIKRKLSEMHLGEPEGN